MGVFDFLKKTKDDSPKPGMELPPVPEMQGVGGFPELPKDQATPKLPDDSLPPLPQMPEYPTGAPAPGTPEVPMGPETKLPEAPGMPPGLENVPPPPVAPMPKPVAPIQAPTVPATAQTQNPGASAPEFPTIPEHHTRDLVPDTIPPLEGVPEPPKVGVEPAPTKDIEAPAEKGKLPEMPKDVREIYEAEPEENYKDMKEQQARKQIRGSIFLKADSVKDILETTEDIRISFRGEDDIFNRINEVKTIQDKKLEKLRQSLEDMQRKLIFIDKTLFEKAY